MSFDCATESLSSKPLNIVRVLWLVADYWLYIDDHTDDNSRVFLK